MGSIIVGGKPSILMQIRWLSGPILDPKFHRRSRAVKFISIHLYGPYLQNKKTCKPRNLNFLKIQVILKSAINSVMKSNKRSFDKLRILSAFGLPIYDGKLIITPSLASNPGFSIKKIEDRLIYSFDSLTEQPGPFTTNFTQLPYNFYHFITLSLIISCL